MSAYDEYQNEKNHYEEAKDEHDWQELLARAEAAEAEVKRLRAEIDEAERRWREDAEDAIRLRAALEEVEWVFWEQDIGWGKECPWCKEDESDGHAPDCARQRALGVSK